jgi:hypothetical protein
MLVDPIRDPGESISAKHINMMEEERDVVALKFWPRWPMDHS